MHIRLPAPRRQKRGQNGFTLVEMLVASSILVIAIIAVVMIVRKGTELQVTDRHRRMARSIINSEFETPEYTYTNYANLTGTTRTVVLDPRGEGTELTGTLTVTVTDGSVSGASSTTIPYRAVTMTVDWEEPDGPQTLTITRWIAQ